MTSLDYARQRELAECVKILESYGIRRPTSAWSIASQVRSRISYNMFSVWFVAACFHQFSVRPSTPPELDKYGHVPMKRPNQRFFFSTMDSSPGSLDRLPADGQEEQDSAVSPAEREEKNNKIPPHDSELQQGEQFPWHGRYLVH